ncbi:MAG: 6,7-dimethyl-8-ribityllumazine synthase [Gammaproteobacteria bacterium]|nr:6,7-dimethyl-8-ribityllumazine synthase [Gammaproteobacteria bacterium]
MQQALDVSALPRVEGARVAILRSKWYADMIDRMHARCVAVLEGTGVARVDTHVLPGCLEMPFAASELVRRSGHGIDAIVCLGIVLKGDTMHFEMIVDECSRGLGEVSRQSGVPILNEVIPVTDIGQAESRTADDEFNKGIEAAAAAVEMIDWNRRQRSG